MSTETRPLACRVCGRVADSASNALGDDDLCPQPGDYTVCINCGALSVFTREMTLRPLTQEEHADLPQNALHAQFMIRQRGLIPK